MKIKSTWWLFVAILFTLGCGGKVQQSREITIEQEKLLQESLIQANRNGVKEESQAIDDYIARNHLIMEKSGTGLRYIIDKQGRGRIALPEMKATVTYKISLLDGTICYTSDSLGVKTFIVDHDQVESGLHEGIKLMHEGDRAKFILPSHLAHGLTGDQNKIPSRSPVVYEIELIQLNE